VNEFVGSMAPKNDGWGEHDALKSRCRERLFWRQSRHDYAKVDKGSAPAICEADYLRPPDDNVWGD
jgi:hypothetical protein